MHIIRITDGSRQWSAIKVSVLDGNPDDISVITQVLVGRHEQSSELLNEVAPGSVADDFGARQYILLAFDQAPTGGFGVGGVYGVMSWVIDHLDPAMPEGLGAAHSEPIMWPIIENADGTQYHIERDHFARRRADDAGLPVGYCVMISPMNRLYTHVVAAYIRDFDAPSGTPCLLPVTT